MEVRDELIHLYTTYNPGRLKDVDALLERFKGREHVILRSLRERYESSEAPSQLSSSRVSLFDTADGADKILSSHRVPALKPVLPEVTVTGNVERTAPPVVDEVERGSATAPTAGSRTASPLSTVGAVSPSPPIPPPLSAPPLSPRATLVSHPATSATRRAEMRELIRQMTSLDVGQLATRVAELTHSLPSSAEDARVPRLQWRQTTAAAQTSAAKPLNVAGQDDVAAVLHHTAVFVSFFADCATRYLALLEETEKEAGTLASPSVSPRTTETRSVGVGTFSPPSEKRTTEEKKIVPRRRSPSPPSPPPKPRSAPPLQPSSSCVRGIRTATTDGGSPLSTDGAGSPPACRTTTVSPLSSPNGHTPERQRRGRSVASLPPPPPPPPPPSPPPLQSLAGQVAVVSKPSSRPTRVVTWSPSAGEANRYGPGCHTLRSGDCIVLQPGVYHETLHLEHCGAIEITSAFPGAAVVLRPASDLEPILTVAGANTRVTLTGIVLVQGDVGSSTTTTDVRSVPLGQPTVPLLSVRDGAEVLATASHFYGGAGGGIVAGGPDTRLRLDLCLISLCGFAGVYVHGGASADISQSKVKKSEVGLRVMRGTFVATETTLEANTSDGIVMYEESMGVLERSNVFDNAGNGVFLASAAELRVVASTIELNALYGVQRASGSTLHVKSSFVRDNGLLPINEVMD